MNADLILIGYLGQNVLISRLEDENSGRRPGGLILRESGGDLSDKLGAEEFSILP